MREVMSGTMIRRVISPVVVADNTAQVGVIVDHQGYGGASYLISTGELTDTDVTCHVLLEDGNDPALTDAAPVIDQTAGLGPNDDNTVKKIGYVGAKRYSRLTVTPVNNTGPVPLAVMCVLGLAGFAGKA